MSRGWGRGSPREAGGGGRTLLGVFLLALLLRVVYLSQIAGTPFVDGLFMDSEVYAAGAERILSGQPPYPGAYYVDPLYFYFLAALLFLTHHSYLLVLLVQAFVGAGSCVVVAWLGQAVSGDRRVGLLAGVGAASYGLLIYYDLSVLKTSVQMLLGVAAVAALVVARRRASRLGCLAAGALAGLAITAHGGYVVLPPALLAWIALGGEPAGRGRLARAMSLAAGVLLVLAPVAARNLAMSGQFVLTNYGPGITFWWGNNPEADGAYRHPSFLHAAPLDEEAESRREAERRAGRPLGPAEISVLWFRESLRWIGERPGDWARLMGRKLALFWNHHEVSNNVGVYFTRLFVPFLQLPWPGYRIWAPLGLVGLVACATAWRRWLLPYLVLGALTVVVLLTAVIDRYRLVVVPYFLIFGAAALVETWDAFRAGRMGRALGLVALGGLAGGLVNLPHFYAPEDTFSRPYYALARYHFEREDELQAERFARRSLEGAPAYGPSHLLLGRIRLSAGRNAEALGHFEAAVRWDPSFPGALYGAGLAAFRLGRWDEAETRFRRALEAEPDGAAPYWLGRVAAARGDAAGAAGWYRRAVTRPGIPPEAWLGLARALLVLGDRAGAEAAYRGVPEGVRDPELERLGLRRGPISPAVPEGGR